MNFLNILLITDGDFTLEQLINYEIFDFGKYTLTIRYILVVLIALFVTRLMSAILKFFVFRYERKRNLDKGSSYAFYQLTKYLLYIFSIIFTLDLVGVQITLLLAGSAALFVGIGLGLQQTFNDLVCGILLLFERSVKVGDIINVDNEVGMVKKIGLRTSIVEKRDRIQIIIPNSKFVIDKVINYTHNNSTAGFDIIVNIAYGTDLQQVEKILMECALTDEDVLPDPEPFVSLVEFGESALKFKLWFFSENIFAIGVTRSRMRFRIYDEFRKHGIVIPFPQRELHIIPHTENPVADA